MNVVTTRLLCVALMLCVSACASSREADNENEGNREEASVRVATVGPELRMPVAEVNTIQLFPARSANPDFPVEAQLPVIPLNSDASLTLKFDLMEEGGRPLAVHFYHANRSWERDLSPGEYLRGFQRDELLDYHSSQGTEIRYTHYTYTFPNENIEFLISGNYIVRVSEQDNEQNVLFERAFFVTEQTADLDVRLDDLVFPGQAFPSLQPVARFRPPSDLAGNVFDFAVCFAQNGRYDQARCSDRPRLAEQPAIMFDLDSRQAFSPRAADYRLDLNSLRASVQIERADFSQSPYLVELKPDYARFPDPGLDPPLNRQPVTSRVRDVGEPDIAAEYVRVHFQYVPTEDAPVADAIYVAGSFNGWRIDSENRLTWNAERGRYEGTALVKQGEHEYTYLTRDGYRLRELQGNVPRRDYSIAAFVYYYDMNLNTDRLLAFGGLRDRF